MKSVTALLSQIFFSQNLSRSNTTTTGAPTKRDIGIADTGSTRQFVPVSTPVTNCIPAYNPIPIRNHQNGSITWSTHEAKLDIPILPTIA